MQSATEMSLSTLLPEAPALGASAVRGVETDSRRLRGGELFVGLATRHGDAGCFLADALARGAAAALLEGPEGLSTEGGRPVIRHPDARRLLGLALRRWHRWDASGTPLLIGVTGTNGKSTVTHIIAELAGPDGMVIGTLGWGRPGRLEALPNTTPEAVTLWDRLAAARTQGARVVALEVSSHALAEKRAAMVPFQAAVFTNLSRDHLDFHGDMEAYFDAKAGLFDGPELRLAVVNADDPWGRRLAGMLRPGLPTLTFGVSGGDLRVREFHPGASGTLLILDSPWGSLRLRSPLIGQSNVLNLLAALATALGLGWDRETVLGRVAALFPPPGRYERLTGGPGRPQVMVDYAHSPDALARVLRDLRSIAKGRVTVVFGCGGDRDRGKRPQMGRIAEQLADRIIVTDDNPRSEPPAAISAEILAGMRQPAAALVIADRGEAIRRAIGEANAGDWVLVAGKGHEDYQDRGGMRLPFSDREAVREALCSD